MHQFNNINRRTIFKIGDTIRGIPIERERSFYEGTQWWAKTEINQYQTNKLRELITFVYNNNPYYQKIMDKNNLKPLDFYHLEDISRLPLLTKDDVKTHTSLLKSRGFDKRAVKAATGGSTGEPLIYYHDRLTQASNRAMHRRGLSWAGFDYGDPITIIMGSDFTKRKDKIYNSIRSIITRYDDIPASTINNLTIGEIEKRIKQNHPKALLGYASNLWWLAELSSSKNINFNIPIVFTTSETLLPTFRSKIETSFSTKVYDYYGLGEIQGLAYQCSSHNYHFSEEKVVIELIPLSKKNPHLY